MGRPRTPTSILALKGAFRKNPNRKRPDEPKESRPLGDPPGRIPANCIPYWQEIVDMVSGGVLTYRDRWAVEIAARMMEKFSRQTDAQTILELAREGELSAEDIKALASREAISASEINLLNRMLAAMGMTPADRSKLSVPVNEKPANRFAALAKSRA